MNSNGSLEVNRFYLRRFIVSDAKDMYLLNLDQDVIKFTGDNSFNDVFEAEKFIQNYKHYSTYDFGRWAVIDKINIEFLVGVD